ncbi:MAG TPA: hypothetical protein V6C95_07460 [Coleofasciculaceae cyanobacterium]
MAAKKSQKSKKSSSAPGDTKLNLVALKPQIKEPEAQPEPVPETVEPAAPILPPIEQTATPVPSPEEPPATTPLVWSKPVGDGEDKGDKEDKEESSLQPTTDDHATTPTQPVLDEQGQQEPKPKTNAIFQAIGIIVATVNFDDNNRGQVILGDKQYSLFSVSNRQQSYQALNKLIQTTGQKQQRLIVYPKVIHFPSNEQPYQLAFQLAGFDKPNGNNSIAKELDDFQFKLCGLWQFIPTCPIPCISVFKNFSPERVAYIKKATPQQRVKFLKPIHIPVSWNDAPIEPLRFNPELDKQQQGRASFVEIMTQFLPEKDLFAFTQLCSPPSQTLPRFLTAGKKDKAKAQQAQKQKQN